MTTLKIAALSLSFLLILTSCGNNTTNQNKPLPETNTEINTEDNNGKEESLTEPAITKQEQNTEINKDNKNENNETPVLDDQPEEEKQRPYEPEENSTAVGEDDSKSWWFRRTNNHIPPEAQKDINITQYDAHYLGDTSEKVVYLTFDEGYENGYTSQILDILKEKDVKAAFFVTKPYIKNEPDLIKRMVEEGHIVGNHSVTHPKMSSLTNEQIVKEINGCAEYFEEVTGTKMPNYFRPPEGVYSIRSLQETQKNGYKTIFWSYAYKDWDTKNQLGKQTAIDMMKKNYHNGSIILLHAVSQSNTEALPEIIDMLKDEGYRFAPLSEI